MRIRSRELPDVSIEIAYRENVEAGVDLTDLFLSGTRCLLFDNGLHLGTPRPFPNDPAISIRIFQIGAEQSHSGFFPQMEVAQFLDGCSRNQRRIPGKHDTWSYAARASCATMRACPVPFCSDCTTNFTPVCSTAERTRSASCPIIA